MSIIYEALKKVQDKSCPGGPPPEPGRLNPDNPRPDSGKSTAIRAVIYILVLSALGLILAEMLINGWFSSQARKDKAAPIAASYIPPPQSLLSPVPAHSDPKEPPVPSELSVGPKESIGRTEQLPALALNGIVLSEDGNIALINDQILKAGDKIEGALVEEIAGNQVTLSFDERKITLKAK